MCEAEDCRKVFTETVLQVGLLRSAWELEVILTTWAISQREILKRSVVSVDDKTAIPRAINHLQSPTVSIVQQVPYHWFSWPT